MHSQKRIMVGVAALCVSLAAASCGGGDKRNAGAGKPSASSAAAGAGASTETSALRAVAPAVHNDNGFDIASFDTSAFARATQFTVDTHPIAVLDTHDVNYDYDVSRISSAYVMRDGALVTNSRMSSKTLVFDSTGRPRRVLSRFGTADGEVGRRQSLTRTSRDTFIVTDFSNRRINYYSIDAYVRSTPLGSVVDERAVILAGALADGTLVMHDAGYLPDIFPNGRSKKDAVLMLINPKGLSGLIANVPDMTVATMRSGWDGQPGRMPLPLRLGATAQIIVWDSLIATGNGDTYRIDLRNDHGNVVAAIEVNAPPRLTTAAMRDADLALRLAELEYIDGKDGMKGEPLRLRKAWPVADTIPAFGAFFVTPNNTLWVTDAPVPGDTIWHATAYNTRREMIGRLTYTGPGKPIGFGDDRVVIRNAGVDEIGTVRVLRLLPIPASQPH